MGFQTDLRLKNTQYFVIFIIEQAVTIVHPGEQFPSILWVDAIRQDEPTGANETSADGCQGDSSPRKGVRVYSGGGKSVQVYNCVRS